MKKLTSKTLNTTLLVLLSSLMFGCSNESKYEEAINKQMANSSKGTLTSFGSGGDSSLWKYKDIQQELTGEDKENYAYSFVIQKPIAGSLYSCSSTESDPSTLEGMKQLKALTKVGLFKEQVLIKHVSFVPNDYATRDCDLTAYTYSYTKDGLKAQSVTHYDKWSVNAILHGVSSITRLRVAAPKVDKIIRTQEQELGSLKGADIRYSYKYTDIADWAKDPDVQAAFPKIKEITSPEQGSLEDTTSLCKNSDGWGSCNL